MDPGTEVRADQPRDELGRFASAGAEGYQSIIPHGPNPGHSLVDGKPQGPNEAEADRDHLTHGDRLNEHGFTYQQTDDKTLEPDEVEEHIANVLTGDPEPTAEHGERIAKGLAALRLESGPVRTDKAVIVIDHGAQSQDKLGHAELGPEEDSRSRSFHVELSYKDEDGKPLGKAVVHVEGTEEFSRAGEVTAADTVVRLRKLDADQGAHAAIVKSVREAARAWGAALVSVPPGVERREDPAEPAPRRRIARTRREPDPLIETTERSHELRFSATEFRADPQLGERLVRGEVYVPFDPEQQREYDVDEVNRAVDTWGTFMRAETLRALAHDYLQFYRNVDAGHNRGATGRAGDPVESYISDGKDGYARGAWVMTVRCQSDVWDRVQRGELTGFSIDVLSRRRPHLVSVRGSGEIPDLQGVKDHPYRPRRLQVRGQAQVRLDELTDIQPNFVSLVDRAANRRRFEMRSDPDPATVIVRCDAANTPTAGEASMSAEDPVATQRTEDPPRAPDGQADMKPPEQRTQVGGEWDESKVHRGPGGQFAASESAGKTSSGKEIEHPKDIEDFHGMPSHGHAVAAAKEYVEKQGEKHGYSAQDHRDAAARLRAKTEGEEGYYSGPKKVYGLQTLADAHEKQAAVKAEKRADASDTVRAIPRAPILRSRRHSDQVAMERVQRALFPNMIKPCLTDEADEDDLPLDFDAEWATHEVSEDLWEAVGLLDDVLSSIVSKMDAFADGQEVMASVGRACQAFLRAVADILSAHRTDEAFSQLRAECIDKMAPIHRQAQRAAALSAALERNTEKREGRKYSGSTAARILAIHDALQAAADHAASMKKEIETMGAPVSTAPNDGKDPLQGASPVKDGGAPEAPKQPVSTLSQVDQGGPASQPVAQPAQSTPPALPVAPPAPMVPSSVAPPEFTDPQSRGPGAAGVQPGPGSVDGDKGPGQAESLLRAMLDSVERATAGLADQAKVLGERLARLEAEPAPPPPKEEPKPEARAVDSALMTQFDEMSRRIDRTLSNVTRAFGDVQTRLAQVEQRRQPSHAPPPDRPRPPTSPELDANRQPESRSADGERPWPHGTGNWLDNGLKSGLFPKSG